MRQVRSPEPSMALKFGLLEWRAGPLHSSLLLEYRISPSDSDKGYSIAPFGNLRVRDGCLKDSPAVWQAEAREYMNRRLSQRNYIPNGMPDRGCFESLSRI